MLSLYWKYKKDIEVYNLQIEKILKEIQHVEDAKDEITDLCCRIAELEKFTKPFELIEQEKEKRKEQYEE